MKQMFFQVEYDLEYSGGNYSSVGQFALVPEPLAETLGMNEAFRQSTGYDPVHIVHYSESELYTAEGTKTDGDDDTPAPTKAELLLEQAQTLQTDLWDTLNELEQELGGVEIEASTDLSGLTIDDLRK